MAEEQIKIKISADAEQFKVVSAAVKKALSDVGKEADITAGKIKNVGKAVSSSNQQWTNLALVIQDLPFGFRGIQNNLPALASSVAGFAGPAYLAFSALVAAVTAYDMGLFGAKKTTDEFAKSLADTNSEIKNSVNYTNSQVATLQSLLQIGLDLNVSENTRKEALKQIKEELGKVNKVEADRIKNIGDAILAVNLYTEAIKAQQLQEVSGKKIAELQIGLIEKRDKLETARRVANKNTPSAWFQAYLGYPDIQSAEADVLKAEGLVRQLEDFNKNAVKANLTNPYSNFNNSKEITKAQKDQEAAAEKARKAREAEEKRMMAAEEYLKNWQIKLNTDIANAQVAEGDRVKKEQEDARKQEVDDYTQRIQLFKTFYANKMQLAEGDRQQQKSILEQQMQDLVYFFETFGMYAGDVGDIFSDVYKKWVDNNKAITDDAMKSIVQIGIGIMNALGPSLDALLEKGASLGEVIGKALTDIWKKLVKVAIAAAIAVAIVAVFKPDLIAQAGGNLAYFGKLVGQGMGMGANLFGSAAGATATSTATNVSNSINPSQGMNVNVTGKISGSDIVLANQRATSNNNVTF
jgi:hypothetical protein